MDNSAQGQESSLYLSFSTLAIGKQIYAALVNGKGLTHGLERHVYAAPGPECLGRWNRMFVSDPSATRSMSPDSVPWFMMDLPLPSDVLPLATTMMNNNRYERQSKRNHPVVCPLSGQDRCLVCLEAWTNSSAGGSDH